MEVSINDKQHLAGEKAHERTHAKLVAALGRFGHNVKNVELSLREIKNRKGGVDHECKILVGLCRLGDAAVSTKDQSLSKAISSCIRSAERAVAKRVDRRGTNQGRLRELERLEVSYN